MNLLTAEQPRNKKEQTLSQLIGQRKFHKMSLNIDMDFFKELRLFAFDKETTMTELVLISLREYMKK